MNLNKVVLGVFCVVALNAQAAKGRYPNATTQAPALANATTSSSYHEDEPILRRNMNLGAGIYRLATVDAQAINTLHAWLEVAPKIFVGAGFGSDQDFGSAAFFGDFRYDFIRRGAASLFGDVQVGWRRINAGGGYHFNGFAPGVLAGFDYAMTENLHASFAYGVQMYFASHWNDHIGITNNDFVGNFGLHWFF